MHASFSLAATTKNVAVYPDHGQRGDVRELLTDPALSMLYGVEECSVHYAEYGIDRWVLAMRYAA